MLENNDVTLYFVESTEDKNMHFYSEGLVFFKVCVHKIFKSDNSKQKTFSS